MAEIVSRRKQNAKHFSLGGRSRQAVFAPHQHYLNDQGNWDEVNLSFTADGLNWRIDRHLLNYRADATGLSVFHKSTGRGIKFLFSRRPDRVLARAVEWELADGTIWRLQARKTGLKTTARILTRRGPRTYRFDAEMLGGLAPPQEHASGNLVHQQFIIARPVIDGADGIQYETSGWRIVAGEAAFDFDDTALPDTAFPYIIDPTTTFNVAASADDGTAQRVENVYPPTAGASAADNDLAVRIDRTFSTPNYISRVGLIRWDTSSLPDDATIDSATLRLWALASTKQNANDRSVEAEWYDAETITTADYSENSTADAHAGTTLASITQAADNDFALIGVSNVSKTGFTGVRLHISGGVPSGSNTISFAAFDHTTFTEPRLIVDYTEAVEKQSFFINRKRRVYR